MTKITTTLQNGFKFPLLGLGTYKIIDDGENIFKRAIELGYTHIDTAKMYENEHKLGNVFEKYPNLRKNVFLTTKIDTAELHPGKIVPALKKQLESLKTDYVDLYLCHTPWSASGQGEPEPNHDLLDIWADMEKCVELGLAKSIGVSNFSETQVERLVKNCKTQQPQVNQIECHPWFNQKELIDHHNKLNVHVSAFTCLGRGTRLELDGKRVELLSDPVLQQIATKHSVTTAEVCLKFQIQRGVSAIAKAASEKNQANNLAYAEKSWLLDEQDFKDLYSLPQSRTFWFENRKNCHNYPW